MYILLQLRLSYCIDYPAIVGFDPLVNQRLLPPTFPRYTKIKTRIEAFDYFGDLLQQLKIICGVADITDLHTILVSILCCCYNFSV